MRGRLILSAWLLGLGLGTLAPAVAVRAESTNARAAGPLPTPQFRRYDTADGLPGSAAYDVVQDQDGIMWFAVGSDLVRFDGVEFRTFRPQAGDASPLPVGVKHSLFVDRDNRLWAGGQRSGLIRYDPGRHGFAQWAHSVTEPSSLSSDKVWAIAQTSDGNLWVGTSAGLDLLLPDGQHFEHIFNPVATSAPPGFGSVHALLAESDGRLWIGSSLGLFLRDPTGRMHQVAMDSRLPPRVAVWRIQGGSNDVRIAVSDGLLRVDRDGVARLLEPGVIAAGDVYSSARDHLGHLWIATGNGLYFDDGIRVVHVSAEPQLRGGLPGRKVWQALVDHEGGLWFALGDGGIAYLAPGWNEFTRFAHVPDDGGSLRNYSATAVLASRDGKLWVGEEGTVDRLDPRTGRVEHLVTGVPGEVLDLAEDGVGMLWIASQDSVFRYAAGRLMQVDWGLLRAIHPWRLSLGPDGNMYVVSQHDGVFRIDPNTLAVAPTPLGPSGEAGVLPNRLAADDLLDWYASGSRLLRWNVARSAFDAVQGLTDGGSIRALERTANGLWVVRDKRFEHYRANGPNITRDRELAIPSNWPPMMLLAVHVDRLGRFWLFCREGLWRFDPQANLLKTFGLRNGLVSGQMRGSSPARAADGTIYLAGPDGVFGLRPDRATALAGRPRLVVASASVGSRGHVRPLPTRSGVLHLGWTDGDVRVTARLSSYADPRFNRYRFWLHGLDSDWVETGNQGEREFPTLESGDYTLEISAAGADGWWSTLAQPLRISVQPPPWIAWQAWALYVSFVTLMLALVLMVQRRRRLAIQHVNMLEMQRALAEHASAAKTSFLATLSHEIRTPMTGLMGMTELLLGTRLAPVQRDYVRSMQRSGSMLMRLLNDALDLARIEAGRLELESAPFDPRELLKEIQELESGVAQLKGIRLEFNLTEDFPRQVVGDSLRIKQVLLNLVSNALKFTDHGRVMVFAQRDAPGLLFSITDTGPGIPEASRKHMFQRFEQAPGPHRSAGTGLGLSICRELVSLMGGSINAEVLERGGTSFHVYLPLATLQEPEASALGLPATGLHWNVLLVESDPETARVVCASLEAGGHSACHVTNGLDALAELAHTSFDIVLLELELPALDGFQVARLIRENHSSAPCVSIVAMAEHLDKDCEASVRRARMTGVVRKPLDGEHLVSTLADIMAARELRGP